MRRITTHNYKLHHSLMEYECFYCGNFAQSKDHVPPISYPLDVEEYIIVRACLLCNSLLGHRPLTTLLARCDYLFIRYQVKFKKALSMPPWTQIEIEELTGKLKRTIIIGLKRKIWIENKLTFIHQKIIKLQGY